MKAVKYLLLICLVACAGACNKGGGNVANQNPAGAAGKVLCPNAQPQQESGIIKGLKGQKMSPYRDVTIGDAVNAYSYFKTREWSVTQTARGQIYVDMVGWFDPAKIPLTGARQKGVEFKFSISPDGPFFLAMVSKAEVDMSGKLMRRPLEDKKSIVDALYNDKKMDI